MASVHELSTHVGRDLIAPRPGPGVCRDCFNLTRGFAHCYACSSTPQRLAAILPISYSPAGGPLHGILSTYKRAADPSVSEATAEIAAVLWRFLDVHESCLAHSAGVDRFELVTTVPSGDRARDEHHPLSRIVGELVGPTRGRYERLLRRTEIAVTPRRFHAARFEPARPLAGGTILLIDDTWASGASAQSAAAALLAAGADNVAAVVVGRHLNPGWGENRQRLRDLRGGFRFSTCALCATAVHDARDAA